MFHTFSFSESIDPGGAFESLNAVADDEVRTSGNFAYIPAEFPRLMGAMACVGANGAQARLVSPTLRRINPFSIAPLHLAISPTTTELSTVNDAGSILLDPNEGLEAQENSNPAAAEQHTIAVWLSDREIAPVKGQIFPVRFQITLAQLAGSWAKSVITLIDELPVRNYAVVGGALVASGAVVFRFVPVGAANRPGAPAAATAALNTLRKFRDGNLGEWFRFNSITPPSVEVLSSAAAGSATYEGVMDIMPV